MTPDRVAAIARDMARALEAEGRVEDGLVVLVLPAPRRGFCGVVREGQAMIVAVEPEEALGWAQEVVDRVAAAELAGEEDA